MTDLVRLEKKYSRQLVVVGIHAPKFEAERNSDSIKKAINRYQIKHPVINDANRKIGTTYKIPGWPTVFLIDPDGYIFTVKALNEHPYAQLDRAINQLIRVHRARKTLNERPLRFLEAHPTHRGDNPLYFPGKILADGDGERLFIADSSNHRIVITDLKGQKIAVAGNGTIGKSNGTFAQATFSDPQGLALKDDVLYVADRGNNLIRALDLKTKRVKTIAGTGFQGKDLKNGGLPLRVGLNSPWDLLVRDNYLFIAMAGHHQIWFLDFKKNRLYPFAGSGKEDIADGGRKTAAFAQPSGLAADDTNLYVADSEVSAIRAVPLSGRGPVSTIVGVHLFKFGDIDGVGNQVRLQHPIGLVQRRGKLFVLDTYNNKIKIIDPARRQCLTFVGGKGVFDEPAGISEAGGKLYVADTNAHRIRVVDVQTKRVTTLELDGVMAIKDSSSKGAR